MARIVGFYLSAGNKIDTDNKIITIRSAVKQAENLLRELSKKKREKGKFIKKVPFVGVVRANREVLVMKLSLGKNNEIVTEKL